MGMTLMYVSIVLEIFDFHRHGTCMSIYFVHNLIKFVRMTCVLCHNGCVMLSESVEIEYLLKNSLIERVCS